MYLHTHKTHTHTQKKKAKSKAKVSSYHKGHAYLAKPGHLCTKQVLCAGAAQSPGAGQGTPGAPTVSRTAGVGTRSPTDINETQPVYFAPQYKTRYPFYRWVGWWAGVLVMVFSSRSGIGPVSSGL